MALPGRGPPTAATFYRAKEISEPLLGWSFHQWTCQKLRAVLEYYDDQFDEYKETASKIDLMRRLDRLIRRIAPLEKYRMSVNDRDRILRAAGLGPRPKFDHRLAEVVRYVLEGDDHDELGLEEEFPYVSEMLKLGPPPAKCPLVSEYKAVADDYRVYLVIYRFGVPIEDDATFAREYHDVAGTQRTYSAEGRDCFIRYALYRSLLKREQLEAFIANEEDMDEESSNEEETSEENTSRGNRSHPGFSTTPSPPDPSTSSQTSISPPSDYLCSEEDLFARTSTSVRKTIHDEAVLILDNTPSSESTPDPTRPRKRKRVDDSPRPHPPHPQPQHSPPCVTCHRTFSPTPDGFTTETMRCCPGCHEIIKVVKEPYHVPTICPQCRHEFCWRCLADWSRIASHGSSEHRGTCPRYREPCQRCV
ncbi:MAG: hypothetical protein HETSPECPRED_007789 [Heterodermia speciosa]|uniref:RING-type domain-containing protein n=1 Tax=Heterodermia speciosa TaxID=116794 RepID=A0A8H3IK85_9LECA|nr:MAG: hypothetical protein HETSPECPRED_007789 [Heterodermia speciosa]